ncbi:acetylcholine receptor subunit alpha-like [Mercenaria mercenaria]|uniref:acetylcholine receptor subunit alpha-like n=1 Tax=Mercenaria mercenaria TaxID=6596 RepID=UPI00234F9FB8|nr:acetylcholine receptor subunit alpha-like [Mercenaria mercenaria]
MAMGIKYHLHVICTAVLIFVYVGQDDCASINDTNVLLRNVMKEYNKNVRPVNNQNDAVHVNASLSIISIQELDEIRGIFSIMGILLVTWHDANMMWDPKDYGGVEYVMTSYIDVWVPELILVNPAEETDTLGKKWQRVYFHHTGFASWWSGDLIKSTCALDVYRFPFDSQECFLGFSAWGYSTDQVKISSPSDEIDFSYYTESPTWKRAKSKTNIHSEGMQIYFHVYLERKPGFVIVNILLPLTFLSLLNVFVFLLLPESGERISYCITVLLSIAVFMTIVSDTLPKSSEPVPVISYKLMFDMVISSVITLVTILNLRLYNKKDTKIVPNWLLSMYLFLFCKRPKYENHAKTDNAEGMKNGRKKLEAEDIRIRRKEENQMQTETMSDGNNSIKPSVFTLHLEGVPCNSIEDRIAKLISEVEENGNEHFQVSWKNISNMVDGTAFIVFTLLSICSFVVFVVITYTYE